MEELIQQINDNVQELKSQHKKLNRSYKVSVGWTTKYRNALAEANERLVQAGLEPVTVISREEGQVPEFAEIKPMEGLEQAIYVEGIRAGKSVIQESIKVNQESFF